MNERPIQSETRAVLGEPEPARRTGGKRSLLVFFTVVAALATLIGLNMN
jgi:hypothetical protein